MLKNILKLEGAQKLNKREQNGIKGKGSFPTTEQACLNCNGFWYAPLCALPSDSICLSH